MKQRKVYQKAGYKEEEASIQLGLVDLFFEFKGRKEAMKEAKDALELFKKLGDKCGAGDALLKTSSLHLDLESPTDALQAAKDARELYREAGDIPGQAQSLQNACSIYLAQARWEDAKKMATEACELSRKGGDKKAEAMCTQTLASVLISKAQMDVDRGRLADSRVVKEALKASEGALKLFRDVDDRGAEVSALHLMVSVHLLSQATEQALSTAREALDVALEVG